MSTMYVADNGDGNIEVMEDGFITHENINKMKFTFSPGQDITESLHKKSSKSNKNISVTKNGRTGYCSLTCTYPNGSDTTSKVVLTDCILQYRENIENDDNNYGKSYVCIGIPTTYIDKMRKDAKENSHISLTVKDKVQRMEGYYWVDCSLDNLSELDTWIIFVDDTGEDAGRNGSVHTVLKGMKSSMVVDIMTTVSGSMSNNKMDEDLDLINGRYTITMKPTEMYIRDISKKTGPILEDATKRKKEGANKSERFKASDKLAEFAMRHLSL